MKIGETIFDTLYLLLAIGSGFYILYKSVKKKYKYMGYSLLVLGIGDAFHLVPRVLSYYVDYDLTFYLGLGKFITSITMSIFYVFLYYIYLENYHIKEDNKVSFWVKAFFTCRILFCLFPQNRWFSDGGSIYMGLLRNVPFLLLGLFIMLLYYKERDNDKYFKYIWVSILLSFVFYMLVVVGVDSFPMFGMFMIPKTLCYIYIIIMFLIKKKKSKKRRKYE